MKPTKPGWYWLRQDYLRNAEPYDGTKVLTKHPYPEVVRVAVRLVGKKQTPVLTVIGPGWKEAIEKTPDRWVWEGPITPPESML